MRGFDAQGILTPAPAVSCASCSIYLGFSLIGPFRWERFGGPGRDRTDDLPGCAGARSAERPSTTSRLSLSALVFSQATLRVFCTANVELFAGLTLKNVNEGHKSETGKVGGPGRDRTDDLFHAMEARSQLRHRPTLRKQLLSIFTQVNGLVKQTDRIRDEPGSAH